MSKRSVVLVVVVLAGLLVLPVAVLAVGLLPSRTAVHVGPAAGPVQVTAPAARTAVEERLGAVLRAVGVVRPGVEEHEFRGARMGGPWRGRYVVVLATRNAAAVRAAEPGSVRDVDGVPVGVFRDRVFGVQARFDLDGLTYTVASLRSRFATGTSTEAAARELAAALVRVLRER